MGIKERKIREKEELRAKILAATAEILIKEGYEKTTIRKVAQSVEYSPRTVYLYFKDKDALLMEIIEEGFAATANKRRFIQDQLDYSKPEELISIQIINNINSAISSPNMYKAVVYLLQYKAYPPGKNQLKVMEDLKEDLGKCYDFSKTDPGNLSQKAELIFAFMRGFNLMLINKLGNISEEELNEFVQECISSIYTGVLGFR